MNAQQKAYAESLLEQNRAMKKRLDLLMQNESNTQQLQQEVERLKKELQSLLDAPASDNATPKPTPEKPEGFSKLFTPTAP
jgi:cell shape-determining protein MreC